MGEIAAKSILSAKNNMNIYRGCTHGCIYCDSRSECYGMTYTFEDVDVKLNAADILDAELSKRRSKCMITTGAMTDPYIPLEAKLSNMRKCLEIVERHGFGVAVLTKSDLILRDIDVLKRINDKSKCVVQMTLTTYDDDLCAKLEPRVAVTSRRYEVLKEMEKAGIPTVVWMTPILPYINDTEENIRGILNYCKDAKAKGVLTFGIGMTLRYGNREYYYKKLDDLFPGLKSKYIRQFGTSYGIKSPKGKELGKLVRDFCKKNNMMCGTKEIFEYVSDFPEREKQIEMWDQI